MYPTDGSKATWTSGSFKSSLIMSYAILSVPLVSRLQNPGGRCPWLGRTACLWVPLDTKGRPVCANEWIKAIFCRTLLDVKIVPPKSTEFQSCLTCVFQVAYLKLDVPLAELWLRITRVPFVQLSREKGNDIALQNECTLFSLLSWT